MNMRKALTETGHRIITPDHYPKNIHVVEAANMAEAIKLADVGLRRNGTQGVVWYRTPNPDANEIAFKLYKAFQDRVGFSPDPDIFLNGYERAAHLADHEKLLWTYNAPWYSEPDTITFSLKDIFTGNSHDEMSNYAAVAASYGADLHFRLQSSNKISMHLDSGRIYESNFQKCRDHILFRGFDTAAVMAQTVAGTLIAETDVDGAPFLKLNKPELFDINNHLTSDLWSLSLNSWLFFHPEWTEFGAAKALVHSFPEFNIMPRDISPTNPPRVFLSTYFSFPDHTK